MRLIKKKIIYGCDDRGDGDSPYLTRYWLLKAFGLASYLHVFHRSDAGDLHDHPWAFVSIILWGGYIEETHGRTAFESLPIGAMTTFEVECLVDQKGWLYSGGTPGNSTTLIRPVTTRKRKRVWPGMVLFRRAKHAHRVELIDGKRAVTLVIRGPYCREWGFFTKAGYEHWKSYFTRRGC